MDNQTEQQKKGKEKKSKPKQQISDKSSNTVLQKPEANLLLNQFNTNSNIFSQLSAMYLQQKQESQDLDEQSEEFLKKQDQRIQAVINTPNFDQEIQSILHSLGKKHEITKLKGLTALCEAIDKRGEDFCYEFIETWVYMFKQFISCEFERKILEEANNVLLKICEKNKKCLATYFKDLYPYWFMQMHDQNLEIANIAKRAFETVFSVQEKRNQAFFTCLDVYLKHVLYILKLTEDKIKEENSALEPAQASEVLERLTVATLNSVQAALQLCYDIICVDTKDSQKEGQIELSKTNSQNLKPKALDARQKLCDLILTTIGRKKSIILEMLEDKQQKKVRSKSSALETIQRIIVTCEEQQVQPYIEQLCRGVVQQIDEKERLIQSALWRSNTLLSVLRATPVEVLAKCDLKAIENRTLEVLRRSAQGVGSPFYDSIMTFFSILPQGSFALERKTGAKWGEENVREKWGFVMRFMQALLQGQQHEEVNAFSDQLVVAYFECIYFIILKRFGPILHDQKFINLKKSARNNISQLIMNAIDPFIENYLPEQAMNIYKQVPKSLAELLENLSVGGQDEITVQKDTQQQQIQLQDEEQKKGVTNLQSKQQEEGKQSKNEGGIEEEWMEIFFENLLNKFSAKEGGCLASEQQFNNYLLLCKHICDKVSSSSICYRQCQKLLGSIHNLLLNNLLLKKGQNNNQADQQQQQQIVKMENLDDSSVEQLIPKAVQYMKFSQMIGSVLESKPMQKQYYQNTKKQQNYQQQQHKQQMNDISNLPYQNYALPSLLLDLYEKEAISVFQQLSALINSLLDSSDSVVNGTYKFEKLSYLVSQILYSWLLPAQFAQTKNNNQIIQCAFKLFDQLTVQLSENSDLNEQNDNFNLRLILIIHIAHPQCAEAFFSEFQALNKDRKQEDYFIQRAMEQIQFNQSNKGNNNSLLLLQRLAQSESSLQKLSFILCQKLFSDQFQDIKCFMPTMSSLVTVSLDEENVLKFCQDYVGARIQKLKSQVLQKGSKNLFIIEQIELGMLFGDVVRQAPLLLQMLSKNSEKLEKLQSIICDYFSNFFELILFLHQSSLNQRVHSFYAVLKRATQQQQQQQLLTVNNNNEQQQQLLQSQNSKKNVIELTLQSARDTLKLQLSELFVGGGASQNNKQQQQQQQIQLLQQKQKQLEVFLGFTLQLLAFLRQMRMQKQIQEIAEIILHEEYFSQVIYREANWLVLRALFQEVGLSVNLQEFFSSIFHKQQNFWILIILMSSSSAYAIISNLQLKKYFLEFSANFLKPLVLENLEYAEKQETVFKFIQYFEQVAEEKSLVYANGLKLLIKQVISEELNKEIILKLYEQLISNNIKSLFSAPQQESSNEKDESSVEYQQLIVRKGIILKNLLQPFQKAISNSNSPKSQEIFEILRNYIRQTLSLHQQNQAKPNQQYQFTQTQKVKFLVALDLAFAFLYDSPAESEDWEKLAGESSGELIKFVFSQYGDSCMDLDMHPQSNNISVNYQISVLFDMVNLVVERETLEPFSNHLGLIEKLFKRSFEHNAKPRKFSSQALARLLAFLRKVIGIIEAFSPDFKDFAIQTVLDTCIIKLKEFQQATVLSDPKDIDFVKDEANDLLIMEFAETISRLATVINSQNLDENLMYELLNCAYPPIQKSCFAVLKHFYANFVPFTKFKLPGDSSNSNNNSQQDEQQMLLNEIKNPELNAENLIIYIDSACLDERMSLFQQQQLEEEEDQEVLQVRAKDQVQEEEKKSNIAKNVKQDQQQVEESKKQISTINDNNQKKQQKKTEKGQKDDLNKIMVMEEEETEKEKDSNDIINPKSYSYLLTWISLINKLTSTLTNPNYDQVKKVIQIYLEVNKHLHQNFLSCIFRWIDALQYSENEWKNIIKPEEVSVINLEWSDFLSKESLFRLIIQTLFSFSTKFQYYLRYWIENNNNKKFTKIAESLIKIFISNGIFIKEIETIELSQQEWQSEEFNIYASRATREIFAVYTKEQQKLEVILKLPNEYPIKPINTEVKKSIKVNQMKINKWLLMMKSLLFNQNNAIKDSLIMWKQNLDKEFEGLEECPICYYIIDTTTQELPKLACKTCNYKFHKICIKRWFDKSNKSECPMCKSQFM